MLKSGKGFPSEISASQELHNSSYLFTPPFPFLSILVLFLRIIFQLYFSNKYESYNRHDLPILTPDSYVF